MNFDRGFIKWQPFNSVIPNKAVLNGIMQNKKQEKPILAEEQIEALEEQVMEAYYSQNKITISFYEQNNIKTMEATITKIKPDLNIIELDNHKNISFRQIININ